MQPFTKITRPGTVRMGARNHSLFTRVNWDGNRLSITGVIGPTKSGNAQTCGQIVNYLDHIQTYAPGWDHRKCMRLAGIWKRYHLNDLIPGTPRQMEHVRKLDAKLPFEIVSSQLAMAGINPDNGYSYGSAWLREEVPEKILSWLQSLPDTDREPNWI